MSNSDEDAQDGRLSFFADPSNWPLFYHTAKNMKARQLAGVVERKARHAVIPRLPINFDQRYERRIPNELVVTPSPIADNSDLLRDSLSQSERDRYRNLVDDAIDGTLTFLNRSIDFGDEIDWNHELLDEYPLLWRLKLQSFEFLEWAVLGFDDPSEAEDIHAQFQRWLLSWAESNPIGDTKYLRRSWIPHSVSLRVLNWSRYAAWCEQADIPVDDRLYRQIFKNALFLKNHIEFEVGGNHLIENAIALVVAGVLFENHETGWMETGLEVLEQAGETQFLADGGHFERSPMYHIMVLQRYATAYNLLSRRDDPSSRLKATTERASGFLREITGPDGEIPLLNDSVHGEQISARSCQSYINACDLQPEEVSLNHPTGSGYRKLVTDDSTLLIDVGEVGPPHLPAHSHNDQLSVLLWIDDVPVLTDTGVYDYAPTSRRQYSRSVSAHNTAQYDETEPIQIGGRYLMGKRTTIHVADQANDRIRAACSRRPTNGPNYQHQRIIDTANDRWNISDNVASDEGGTFSVRYHFAPGITLERGAERGGEFTIFTRDSEVGTIEISGADTVQVVESPYFSRYGKEDARPAITATAPVGKEISTQIAGVTDQTPNAGETTHDSNSSLQ